MNPLSILIVKSPFHVLLSATFSIVTSPLHALLSAIFSIVTSPQHALLSATFSVRVFSLFTVMEDSGNLRPNWKVFFTFRCVLNF